MTILDDELLPTAKSLLDELGKAVTLVEDTRVYDPDTGSVVITPGASHTVKCTPPFPYNQHEIDGDAIRAEDARVFLAGQDIPVTPSVEMRVVIDGDTFAIRTVVPIYSGESVVLYGLQLRR